MKYVYAILLLALSGCATLTNPTVLQGVAALPSLASNNDECIQIGDNNTCDKGPHVEKQQCPNGVDEKGNCVFLICQYDSQTGERHCSQSIDERGNPGPEYVK